MTHLTSCKNVISIEHTASTSAVFVFCFGWFCRLQKERISYGLVKNMSEIIWYLEICTTQKLYSFANLSLGFILKISASIFL